VLDHIVSAIPVLSLSPGSTVGGLAAWVFYPLLGGGAALLVTAALMADESGRIIRQPASTSSV
jgi:hypothetical protein